MVPSEKPSSPVGPSSFQYVVGIDLGSQTCSFCVLNPYKSQVVKPTEFVNHAAGFTLVRKRLERLEATSRYGENLYRFLEGQDYQFYLLHPRQAHQFAEQRGLHAKTNHLDATTIARLLSGEARRGNVPSEAIATYHELVRLHSQLSDDISRSKNEMHALLTVLFPEFPQVFADPAHPTALGLLKRYPSAQAMGAAGIEAITATLHELAPRHFELKTAQHLLQVAQQSMSSGVATAARSRSLAVLCDQLQHTQTNLTQLEEEIDRFLDTDDAAKGLQSVPECGRKMVAVLRAELGDVARFERADQVVAYAGLDVQVRQSGKRKEAGCRISTKAGCHLQVKEDVTRVEAGCRCRPFCTQKHRLLACPYTAWLSPSSFSPDCRETM